MDKNLYSYKAQIIGVIDGDTIDIEIDLGFDVSIYQRVRVYNVDTPETRTRNLLEKEAGIKVKKKLIELLLGGEVLVKTIKEKGKFGRYIADIYVENDETITSISDFLLVNKYAKKFDGTTKREPWTDKELEYIVNN